MTTHIEFLGLPGSGKSTLHREAIRFLRTHDRKALDLAEAISVSLSRGARDTLLRGWRRKLLPAFGPDTAVRMFSRSQDRFLSLAEFLAGNPALGEIVLASQACRDISSDHKRLVLGWMFGLFAAFHFVRGRLLDHELLLLDEGFCSRVSTLFGYGPIPDIGVSEAEVSAYVDRTPFPGLVLVVDASVELCEARLDSRGWPERLAGAGRLERRRFLERCGKCLEITVARLQDRGVRVHRIGNGGSLAGTIKAMESGLLPILRPGLGRPVPASLPHEGAVDRSLPRMS